MEYNGGMTPADVAAVMGNNNDMFGGNSAWWIIILFLFAFAGNGWGGGYGGGAAENYVLASDFATLQRQIDSGMQMLERKGDAINNGLCDGFYAQNTTMLNGFANAELSRAQNQANTIQAINANNIAAMQNQNALQAQIAQCCCDNRYESLQNAYALQGAVKDGFCQTNYANANNTRDIVDNANANTRAILDALNCQKTEAMKEKIAEQQAQINALNLAASQAAQNSYLINQLRPAPIPAYQVQNPFMYGGCGC